MPTWGSTTGFDRRAKSQSTIAGGESLQARQRKEQMTRDRLTRPQTADTPLTDKPKQMLAISVWLVTFSNRAAPGK
jgi:hypothetical protein